MQHEVAAVQTTYQTYTLTVEMPLSIVLFTELPNPDHQI